MAEKDITISTLHQGFNVQDDAAALAEGEVTNIIGFDLTIGGKLATAQGNAAHDLGNAIPANVEWVQIVYMNGTRYVLASTDTTLYVNGVDVGVISGRFKARVYNNNIYIMNRSKAIRFDGTTAYQWGITNPTTMPTLTVSTHKEVVLTDFEGFGGGAGTDDDFITNAVNCTIASESTIVKQGTKSIKMSITGAVKAQTRRSISADLTQFSDASVSPDGDLIEAWIYAEDASKLSEIRLAFNLGSSQFKDDFFSYAIDLPGKHTDYLSYGAGRSWRPRAQPKTAVEAGIAAAQASELTKEQSDLLAKVLGQVPTTAQVNAPADATPQVMRVSSWYGFGMRNLDETQAQEIWNMTHQSLFASGSWYRFLVPKSYFVRTGSGNYGWDDVNAVLIEVISLDTTIVYLDRIRLIGGGKLHGDYWFLYTWGRGDGASDIRAFSGPARSGNGQLVMSGPHRIERQPVSFGTRTASTDPQVNRCCFFVVGGGLSDWWLIHQVNDNGTVGGTITAGEDDVYQRLITLDSQPAPYGSDFEFYMNRMWAVGMTGQLDVIRASDISDEGDILIENWPYKNGYILSASGEAFLRVHELNNMLIVRAKDKEYQVSIDDPTSYISVRSEKRSGFGLLGEDAVIEVGYVHAFPAHGGFVQSDGVRTQLILPGAAPLSKVAYMKDAKAVFRGLQGYISYQNSPYGVRTTKVDLFSGAPRVAHLNDKYFTCFTYDAESDTIYGIIDNELVILEAAGVYTHLGQELQCLVRTKKFTFPDPVAFTSVSFAHQTRGMGMQLRVFIDEQELHRRPFTSTVPPGNVLSKRTWLNWYFGPVNGTSIQLQIDGAYSDEVEIFLPIRIRYSDAYG